MSDAVFDLQVVGDVSFVRVKLLHYLALSLAFVINCFIFLCYHPVKHLRTLIGMVLYTLSRWLDRLWAELHFHLFQSHPRVDLLDLRLNWVLTTEVLNVLQNLLQFYFLRRNLLSSRCNLWIEYGVQIDWLVIRVILHWVNRWWLLRFLVLDEEMSFHAFTMLRSGMWNVFLDLRQNICHASIFSLSLVDARTDHRALRIEGVILI